jgi:hypothetical protein
MIKCDEFLIILIVYFFRIVDANGIATPVRVTSIKRVPLAEVPTNTPSPSFVMGVKSTGCENRSSSCSGGVTINRMESTDHSSRASRIGVPLENDHLLDSLKTPLKQPECSTLIDSVSMPSILDDDFDESILEEIDVFCDQKSAEKAERKVPSGEIFVGSQHTNNCSSILSTTLEPATGYEDVRSQGTLDSGSHLDTRANGSGTSQTVQTGNMPEEYLKYLQSLNDRQREASCYDISVPLMIVAGPGSGKVPLFLPVSLSYTYSKMIFVIVLVDFVYILYSVSPTVGAKFSAFNARLPQWLGVCLCCLMRYCLFSPLNYLFLRPLIYNLNAC